MKQVGSTKILIIVLVVAAIIAIFYWVSQRQPVPYTPPKVSQTEIQNTDDLMSTSNELDNTNIDGPIDQELNQNDTDAASL